MTAHPDHLRDVATTAREGAAGYATAHRGEYVVMVPHPNGGVVSVTGLRFDNPTVAIARVLWAGWRNPTWPPRPPVCAPAALPGPPPLICPHCDRVPALVDDTDHWACHCGGHGHTSQLVPEGKP